MARDFLAFTPAGSGDEDNDFVGHNSSHNSGMVGGQFDAVAASLSVG
jgi:hypothetical protein